MKVRWTKGRNSGIGVVFWLGENKFGPGVRIAGGKSGLLGAGGILGRRIGVARKAREIEQTDIKALVVDAVQDHVQAGAVGAADAVFRDVTDARATVRQRSRHGDVRD